MPLGCLAAVAILAKLPTLGIPAFWDETAWLGQAGWLADAGLTRALPGTRPDAQFFGHPPGLHLAAAVLFTVFGRSIEVAHGLIAILGAVGVCATFAYVRAAHDRQTALLASLLLLFSPAWFSSAGVFLADLPVAAMGMAACVFMLRGWWLAYVITAACMVLVKETSVALVAAFVAFRLLTRLPVNRDAVKDALRLAAPLLVFLAFITVQKVATGRFFYIYDFETDALFDLGVDAFARQAAAITHWMLLAQFRWVLTLAIVVDLVLNRDAWRRNELFLFALVAMASGYVFSAMFYMPRYILPVFPFFYALGAVSLMSVARTPARQLAAGLAVFALTVLALARDPYRDHGEDNLQYRDVVRTHQAMANDVTARYAGARIVSAWPTAAELGDPLLGYVAAPLRVSWFRNEDDLAGADIAVVARPANDEAAALEEALRRARWTLAAERRHGPTYIRLYERPR